MEKIQVQKPEVKGQGEGEGEGEGVVGVERWRAVVAVLWLLAVASVVGMYRLGRLHGQIAALESEVVHGKWK